MNFRSGCSYLVYPPRSRQQAQEMVEQANERAFRHQTRALLGVTQEEIPEDVFDNIWCQMCVIGQGHADRYSACKFEFKANIIACTEDIRNCVVMKI